MDCKLALNTLIGSVKSQDWMVHIIGQSIGTYTDATHDMTLSAISIPYYKHIMSSGLKKFVRFAENVWNVSSDGKSEQQITGKGLMCLENWMKEIGVAMNITELGVTEDMLDEIAKDSFIMQGGYKILSHDEIVQVIKDSLQVSFLLILSRLS